MRKTEWLIVAIIALGAVAVIIMLVTGGLQPVTRVQLQAVTETGAQPATSNQEGCTLTMGGFLCETTTKSGRPCVIMSGEGGGVSCDWDWGK